jgi:hypothetical protein
VILCAICMAIVLDQIYILYYPGEWARSSAVFVAGLEFWWYIVPAIAYAVLFLSKRDWRIDAFFFLSVLLELLILLFPAVT